MAKIGCICGNTISDNTDFIPNKAHYFADQDEEIVRDIQIADVWHDDLFHYYREMFQCTECGRIIIEQAGTHKFYSFKPDNPEVPKDLLNSAEGDTWKACLRAHWDSKKQTGDVGYLGNNEFKCFVIYTSRKEVETKYHELLKKLVDRDLVSNAFLRIDGEIVHRHNI